MTDKIKNNLEKILEYLEKAAKEGAEFAQEQTPILINEILTYYTIIYGLYIAISLALFVVSYKLLRRAIRKHNELLNGDGNYEDENEIVVFPSIGFVISGIAGAIIFAKYIALFVKVVAAPRLFLLDHVINNYL